MNWGKGIITGMIIFMLFILSMCIYMFRMPADEYDHQYYEKGLNYNLDYEQERQVIKDHAQPSVKQNRQMLMLQFTTPVKGTLKLVRPANQALDQTFQLNSSDTAEITIPLATVRTGQWQLIINWENNHHLYLYQQEIYIQ